MFEIITNGTKLCPKNSYFGCDVSRILISKSDPMRPCLFEKIIWDSSINNLFKINKKDRYVITKAKL